MRKTANKIHACIEALETRRLMSALYVATNGNDGGTGAIDSPWASIQHAVDMASPGDVIRLRSGVYHEGDIKIDKADLKLRSAPGEWASIVAPNDDQGVQVVIRVGEDANNFRLKNLDVSGGYYYTLKTESTWDTGASDPHGPQNLLITGCKLHDSGADVVKLTPATNNATIDNTEIYNSGRTSPDNAEGLDGVQANNFTMRNSYIHDTTTNGIYLKGGSVNTLIENNRISDTGHSGILLGQSSDENWFDTSVNPHYYESIDGVVRNNLVWNTQGAGIGAWAALRPQIYNNTLTSVAQSMFAGLLVQGQEHWIPDSTIVPSTDVSMYNNIVRVDPNSDRPVLEVRDQGLTGYLHVDNNLYYKGGQATQIWDLVHGYEGGLGRWQAMGYDTHSMNAQAVLDSANGWTPRAGSPAIDRGAAMPLGNDYNGDPRAWGSGMDIGAQEMIY